MEERAMARKSQKKQNIELILGEAEKAGGEFVVKATAIAHDDSGALIKGGEKVIFCLYRICNIGCEKTAVNISPSGFTTHSFKIPLEKAGKKVVMFVTMELNGRLCKASESVILPKDPDKKYGIQLRAGKPRETADDYEISFEAFISLSDLPANNVAASVYNDRNELIGNVTTGPDGKGGLIHRLPLSTEDKSLKFRAEIDGTTKEATEVVNLKASKFVGWKKTWILAKTNWQSAKPAKLVNKTVFMAVLAIATLLIIHVLGNIWGSIVLGVVSGTLLSWTKKYTYKHSLVFGMSVILFSIAFPRITLGTISATAWIMLFFGVPTYVLEGLTKKDFYPWLTLKITTAMIPISLIVIAVFIATDHDLYLGRVVEWLTSNATGTHSFASQSAQQAKDFLETIAWTYPRSQHVYAGMAKLWGVITIITYAIQFFLVSLLVLTITIPGELVGWFKANTGGGEKKGVTSGHVIMLDILMEILINRVTKLKGK